MHSVLIIFLFIFFVDHANSEEAANNGSTSEPIVYMLRSRYDETFRWLDEIPKMRIRNRAIRKQMCTERSAELVAGDKVRHDLYLKVYYQKVAYEMDLWKHRYTKHSLLYSKYLTILQNHIEDYERLTLLFEPDMDQIKRYHHTKMAQAEEIRRQRWSYILYHCSGFQIIRDLMNEIDKAGIQYSDFSKRVARGYNLLERNLRPKKIHEIPPMRFLPDLSTNITGDFEVDKCFVVLMNDFEKKHPTPKSDSRK